MNIVKNVKVRQNNYSDSLIKMTITNEAIVFIFSKKSQKKPKNISFSKIKSLDVTADISNYRDVYDQLPTTHCVTNIKINGLFCNKTDRLFKFIYFALQIQH